MSLQSKINPRPQADSKCRFMLKTYYKNTRINALYQKYLSIEKDLQNTSFLGEHAMRGEEDNAQKQPDSVFDQRVKKYKIVKVENDFQLEKTNFLLVSERKANSSFFQRKKTKYHPSQSSWKTLVEQKSQNQNIMNLKEKDYLFEIDFQASKLKIKRRKSEMTRLYNNDFRNSKSAGEKANRNYNKLLYFQQLKNYPKIVEFTIERKIKKQNKKEEDKKQKDRRKRQFVRRMEFQRTQRQRSKEQTIDASPSPMKTSLLIQNHLRKIYTKISKKTFVPQSHEIDMQNFIKKQQDLLFQNKEVCLSQNTQLRLKEDFNKIAFNLCTSRRKHQNSFRSKMIQQISTRASSGAALNNY